MKTSFSGNLIKDDKIESPGQDSVSFTAYVVRLYRFQQNNPQLLQGIVEEVGTTKKSAFIGYDELWTILNSSKAVRAQK